MHCEEAAALPILDKSHLFLPLPTNAQNPNRSYLQCPATGHVYCTSTGSLHCSFSSIKPLASNISSLNQRNDFNSFPSNPIPSAIKKSVKTNNTDQPVKCNNASSSPSTGRNKSTNVKNEDQPVQGNRGSVTENNKDTDVKNADHHMQGNGASTTPNTKSNKTSNTKHRDQPILSRSAVITPKNQSKASSNSKNSSESPTKKHKNKKKKCSRTTNDQSVHAKDNLNTSSITNLQQENKIKAKKQNKTTALPDSKSTISSVNNSSNIQHLTPVTRITPTFPSMPKTVIQTQNKTHSRSEYNPFVNSKRKSFRYYITGLQPMTEPSKPIEISLGHLLFPQSSSQPKSVNVSDKSPTKFQVCPSFNNINRCAPKPTKKPSLHFSREDLAMIDLQNRFRKITCEGKTFEKMPYGFKNIRKIGKNFNYRTHHLYKKQRSLQDQYKNCIVASSVHEIIHSRFAKDTNEQMPVSQIKAMLSSGIRKLRTRQRWLCHMEEEAIHKYKEMNYEHNIQVKEYDVLHHKKKSWLVSYGRWVISSQDEDTWPLLVKCLHKYPDSTLRQASRHHSFCLSWNRKSYNLRRDHAYYTQIQCHMAVTETLYAELIVHTHKETIILPVYFDLDFWKQTEEILEIFFISNILPYLRKFHPKCHLAKSVESLESSQEDIEELAVASTNSWQFCQQQLKKMAEWLEDQDNSRRRRNLCIKGLPESYLPETLLSTTKQIFINILGVRYKDNISIEWAYRVLPAKSKAFKWPRDIICRLFSSEVRDDILRINRESGTVNFEGSCLSIYPDVSKMILSKRRFLKPLTDLLRNKQIQYRWLFPFGITFQVENRRYLIHKHEDLTEALTALGQPDLQVPDWSLLNDLTSIPAISPPTSWKLVGQHE